MCRVGKIRGSDEEVALSRGIGIEMDLKVLGSEVLITPEAPLAEAPICIIMILESLCLKLKETSVGERKKYGHVVCHPSSFCAVLDPRPSYQLSKSCQLPILLPLDDNP